MSQSSVELAKAVPVFFPFQQIHFVQLDCGRTQEHVLLELAVVPHRGLQGPALHHVQGDPIFKHFHEARIAVLFHHLSFSFSLFSRIRVQVHLHIRIRLLLEKEI